MTTRIGAGYIYFDNYITWVFAMHVHGLGADGRRVDARTPRRTARTSARMDAALSRIFLPLTAQPANMGAASPTNSVGWARRCGRISWGIWPHSVGMLKRLVGKHLRWYVDRGAIRADGTLRQSLTASGSPEVIERYISTGATYWAMQAFSGLWSLPDDDPFWTAEEEPLPAEQGDFVKVFPQPGWVLAAHDGHVQQFNAGSGYPGYGNKYTKLVYSTRNPFNVGLDNGQPSLDSCLHLSEGGVRGQRQSDFEYAVGDAGWIRTRYSIQSSGHHHQVDTTLIPLGNMHLRAHRITLDPAAQEAVSAEEGSASVGYDGYDSGTFQAVHVENGWLFAEIGGQAVGIKPLRGYSSEAQAVPGSPNSVSIYNLLTILTAVPLKPQHDLICALYAGDSANTAQLPAIEQADWDSEGRFVARVAGQTFVVPPLA